MVESEKGWSYGCRTSWIQRSTKGMSNLTSGIIVPKLLKNSLPPQVKRVLCETRINAIVNRLNKTEVEKTVDLAEEKANMEKEKRANARKLQLERVCITSVFALKPELTYLLSVLRQRKKLGLLGRERRKRGQRITHTMKYFLRILLRRARTKTALRTIMTTSCKCKPRDGDFCPNMLCI